MFRHIEYIPLHLGGIVLRECSYTPHGWIASEASEAVQCLCCVEGLNSVISTLGCLCTRNGIFSRFKNVTGFWVILKVVL